MRLRPRFPARSLAFALITALLAGCAAAPRAPRSTRLTAGDFEVLIPEMVSQLAASDFLRDRGPDSPRAVITTERVRNLTSDLISPAEGWMLVNRVQTSLPLRELAEKKNLRFQIPPERAELLRAKGFAVGDAGPPGTPGYAPPTHVMTADFRSATRVARVSSSLSDARTEYYYMEFKLLDAQSRELAWSGRCEFHRAARGKLID